MNYISIAISYLLTASVVIAEYRGYSHLLPTIHKNRTLITEVRAVNRSWKDTNEEKHITVGNNKLRKNSKKETNSDKTYGVSLGGWLVTEPWISPSLYENVAREFGQMPIDEYTLTRILGRDLSKQLLVEHWSTFYNEEDFKAIKEFGLNLVRIPIGYWAFGLLVDDPYVQGQEEYLDQAIKWAAKYGLYVQIDIHGMPGSQNGFDNSGKRTFEPDWLELEENMALTYKIVDYILDKYGDTSLNIHSIEIVNEPFGALIDLDKLEEFYSYTYDRARSKGVNLELNYHDAFLSIGSWDWFMRDKSYFNITTDHHLYEIFSTWQINQTIEEHIEIVREEGFEMSKEFHPNIVGEFSGALTDCTKYINGVGLGSRYDGTFQNDQPIGSCENHTDFTYWSEESKNNTKRFLEVQFDTFEKNSKGWIFWCYKTENTIEWDFKRLAELGILPQPITGRTGASSSSPLGEGKSSPSKVLGNNASKRSNENIVLFKEFQMSKVIYTLLVSFILICLTITS